MEGINIIKKRGRKPQNKIINSYKNKAKLNENLYIENLKDYLKSIKFTINYN